MTVTFIPPEMARNRSAASRNGEIKRWDQYDPRAVDLGCDHALLDPPTDEAKGLFELGGVLFVGIRPATLIRSILGRVI